MQRVEEDEKLAQKLQQVEDDLAYAIALHTSEKAARKQSVQSSAVPGGEDSSLRAAPAPPLSASGGRHSVAIDGMNVGMNVNFRDPTYDGAGESATRQNGRKPVFARAITGAIEHYESRGHLVTTFLPEWCVDGGRDGTRYAHGHELLRPLVNRGTLILTPARMDDDNWLIDHAKRTGCKILTNDHLESHISRGKLTAAWRDAHVIKFCFVANQLRPMEYEQK